jgi:hypothetical protein
MRKDTQRMDGREIYAGILVKSRTVELTFGECRNPKADEPRMPLDLYRVPELRDWSRSFSSKDEAAAQIGEAARYVVECCPTVRRLGVCTYGPLESVKVADRGLSGDYGRVAKLVTHKFLNGLPIYDLMRRVLDDHDVTAEVRVHTDVQGGAIAESLDRTCSAWLSNTPLINPGSLVFFAHIAEGVGGAWAMGGRPALVTLHSEIGAVPVQILADDSYALGLQTERREKEFPVRLEEVTYLPAILARAGLDPETESLADVSPDHPAWEIEAEYIAQMVQAITMMISPARCVLHGPVFETKPKAVRLLARVRKKFKKWVSSRDGVPVWYRQMNDASHFIDLALSGNPMLRGAMMLAALPGHAFEGPEPLWEEGEAHGRKR